MWLIKLVGYGLVGFVALWLMIVAGAAVLSLAALGYGLMAR